MSNSTKGQSRSNNISSAASLNNQADSEKSFNDLSTTNNQLGSEESESKLKNFDIESNASFNDQKNINENSSIKLYTSPKIMGTAKDDESNMLRDVDDGSNNKSNVISNSGSDSESDSESGSGSDSGSDNVSDNESDESDESDDEDKTEEELALNELRNLYITLKKRLEELYCSESEFNIKADNLNSSINDYDDNELNLELSKKKNRRK